MLTLHSPQQKGAEKCRKLINMKPPSQMFLCASLYRIVSFSKISIKNSIQHGLSIVIAAICTTLHNKSAKWKRAVQVLEKLPDYSDTSDGLHPTSGGLHPTSDGLHPNGLQPTSDGLQPTFSQLPFVSPFPLSAASVGGPLQPSNQASSQGNLNKSSPFRSWCGSSFNDIIVPITL